MKKTLLLVVILTMALTSYAVNDLTTGKSVLPLGGYKTWTHGTTTFTNDLSSTEEGVQKGTSLSLITTENNTTDVYLLPQIELTEEEINAQGYQGFYIDLGETKTIGSIATTWEGAFGTAYKVYVSDTEPVPNSEDTSSFTEILSVVGANSTNQEYAVNTQVGGRYLIFMTSNCTYKDWGCKIHTLIAYEAETSVLTSIKTSQSFVTPGNTITLTGYDQYGASMVTNFMVGNTPLGSGVSTYTIPSDASGLITFKAVEDPTKTCNIYVLTENAIPSSVSPTASLFPASAGTTAWSDGWENGTGSQSNLVLGSKQVHLINGLGSTFIRNSNVTANENTNWSPKEKGYEKLVLNLISVVDATGTLELRNYNPASTAISLTAGEWKQVEISLADEGNVYNTVLAFSKVGDVYPDVAIANIYFRPNSVDETAPVLNTASLKSVSATSATLSLQATDETSETVTFTIIDETNGVNIETEDIASGTETDYTVYSLNPSTSYTFTIKAKDKVGNVSSTSINVAATTTAIAAAPKPNKLAVNVKSLFSNEYTAIGGVTWNSGWEAGSTIVDATLSSDEAKKVTAFKGFGITMSEIDINTAFESASKGHLCFDIYPLAVGTVKVDITKDGFAHSGNVQDVSISTSDLDKWIHKDILLSNFIGEQGFDKITALLFNGGDGSAAFYIDNIYFYKEVEDVALTYGTPDANNVVAVTGTLSESKLTDFNSALTGVAYDLTGITLAEAVTISPANVNTILIVTAEQKAAFGTTKNMVIWNAGNSRYEGDIEIVDQNNANAFATQLNLYATNMTYTRAAIAADKYVTTALPFVPTTVTDGFSIYYPEAAPSSKQIRFIKTNNWSREPYILHNTNDVATDFVASASNVALNFTPVTVRETLKSVFTSQTLTSADNAYVLQNSTPGLVEFKKANGVGIGAFRGYLYTTSLEARLAVVFGNGETTKIGTINANGEINVEDGVYYNLAGQRVQNPKKGIYIINGKKVVLK